MNTSFHATPASIRKERLGVLQFRMAQDNIHAIIIPSSDPHMSEYLPVYWQGRAWLSGFTGSTGTLVVMADFVGLWTDSRYWVQAPKQLEGTGISLMKLGVDMSVADYLASHLPKGSQVAVDGAVLSLTEYRRLQTTLEPKGISLVTDKDYLGGIWHDRPSLPTEAIYAHDERLVDMSMSQKLAKVREVMLKSKVDYHLISSLDDIAWLTNLRGSDVLFNPVFLSHMWIEQDRAILFVDLHKINNEIKASLDVAGIEVQDYGAVGVLTGVAGRLLIDPDKVSLGVLNDLPSTLTCVESINPTTILKSQKSQADINHIKEAMRQDGVALCEFFARLEDELAQGTRLSELDIDRMLIEYRQQQPNYVSPSFETIAGFRANGAVVHYRATDADFGYLDGNGLLLIDSGAQYQNGTTDITRMVGIGKIGDDEKRDVTYVLKAHIALAMAYFPKNIPSSQLDVLARNELWRYGVDYGHGTGHGVGYFLNVHEGPQTISRTAPSSPCRIMMEGMITSNEPGLYRENEWGIRLENLVVAVKADMDSRNQSFGEFLKFETLTLCPFDIRLILPDLLNDTEKTWLNDYHKKVHDELIGRVYGRAKDWLIERTQAI